VVDVLRIIFNAKGQRMKGAKFENKDGQRIKEKGYS
jgi:hypothetical protein